MYKGARFLLESIGKNMFTIAVEKRPACFPVFNYHFDTISAALEARESFIKKLDSSYFITLEADSDSDPQGVIYSCRVGQCK